jgi:hypothetical protein
MAIRLRKPDGSKPLPLSAALIVGDPPIYRETLHALVGRDPTFLLERRVAPPALGWSALDAVIEQAREEGAAA